MRSMEFSGKTVDEAIFHGLNEMGVTIDEVEIETLQDETKGLFGLGAKMAVVRLTEREEPIVMDLEKIREELPKKEDREPREKRHSEGRREGRGNRNDRPRRERSEAVEDKYEYSEELAKELPACEFLSELLNKMNVPSTLSAAKEDDGYRICIKNDTDGLLIGRRGETLDAIQYLVSLYVNHGKEDYTRITLDTEGYRSRREETLKSLAHRKAAQVRSTGRSIALEAMNPYERRVMHSALQDFKGVTTYSEGEEPNRHLVIAPSDN